MTFFPFLIPMVLLDYSKAESSIPHSIQTLVSKLVLHLIGVVGSFEGIDRAEMHIRNQNTSKYLKFCQALLSQESFIEQDQDLEEFLFYFLRSSEMFTDDQVLFELRHDIYAAAKDMEMEEPERFLVYGFEKGDLMELMNSLAFAITGDEIDEYHCSSQAVYRKMMMNDDGKHGKTVVALCNNIIM